MERHIANWGRRPGQPMSDEQRRAMFWRMSQGGGRAVSLPTPLDRWERLNSLLGGAYSITLGVSPNLNLLAQANQSPAVTQSQTLADHYDRMRAQGIKIYEGGDSPSWWDKTKSFLSGAWEGTKGGSAIVAGKVTMGATDALGRALGVGDSSQFQGWDYDAVRTVGDVGSFVVHAYTGQKVLGLLGRAYASTSLAKSALGQYGSVVTLVGSIAAKNKIDAYVERNPGMNPYAVKALSMASQLSGYVATYAGMGLFGRAVGAIARKIPVAAGIKMTSGTFRKLKIAAELHKSATDRSVRAAELVGAKLSGRYALSAARISKYASRMEASLPTWKKIAHKVLPKDVSARAYAYLSKATGTNLTGGALKAQEAFLKRAFTKSGALNLSGATQLALRSFDRAVRAVGTKVIAAPFRAALDAGWNLARKATPAKLKPLAQKVFSYIPRAGTLHRGLTAAANFTGGTIKSLPRTAQNARDFKAALPVLSRAKASLARAHALPGGTPSAALIAKTTPEGVQAYLKSLVWKQGGGGAELVTAGMPKAAGAALWDKASAISAAQAKLSAAYQALRAPAVGLAQSGLVAGGLAQVAIRDELRAKKAYDETTAAIREGERYQLPMDEVRGRLHTAWVMFRSSFGNPFERPNRPNQQSHAASIGAYRAGYDAIKEEGKFRGWSKQKTQDELDSFARAAQPWGMHGKEIWTWGTAAGAVGNWKLGELLAKARRSSTEKATLAYDADTIFTERHPQGFRVVGLDAPETAKPNTPADYLGPESEARIRQLVPPDTYFRAVRDSSATTPVYDALGRKIEPWMERPAVFYDARGNPLSQTADGTPRLNTQNNSFDKYWRPLAQIQKPLIPGTGPLLNLPYFRHLVPTRNVGETMIREGFADIAYRHMKGGGDEEELFDKARAIAQARGTGIWSPEGRAALPWVGKEKTREERRAANYRRMTGQDWEAPGTSALQRWLGLGFMTSGNTGILRSMPQSGTITAQVWNTALAVLGAVNYNAIAERATPRYAVLPRVVTSDWHRRMEELGYTVPPSSRTRATAAELRALDALMAR